MAPPSAWHPSRQLTNELECPPKLLPAIDTLIAASELGWLGYLAARRPDAFDNYAGSFLLVAPWMAAAAYGWRRTYACEDELSRSTRRRGA